MTAYVHTPRQHQPDKYAALLAEKARIETETRLYETLAAQRQRLAEAKDNFHQSQPEQSPAERIRQAAILRNGDTPEVCQRRLTAATADAAQWTDPRTRTTEGTK